VLLVWLLLLKAPENEVEADDGFRLRRLVVVENRRLSLRPDEAAAVHQETVVAGVHLTLGQHCTPRVDRHKQETLIGALMVSISSN